MIKLPDIQHLSLQRVREIAEGSTPLMGEVQRLAVTALGYVEENKSAVKAFQSTGFILLEREQELEEALAEVQRLNAAAQPVSDGWIFEACENEPCQNGAVVSVIGADIHLCAACAGDKKYSRMKIKDLPKRLSFPLPAAPGGQDD